MKAVLRKAAALGLCFALGCGALVGCGSKAEKIDGSKVLMTVNGEDVRLGVGSFYAKYEQASIYQIYAMYFGQTTGIFDNIHDGEEETYGDEMKESVISDLKKMMVIKQHAEEYGVSLTDEQKDAIDAAAQAYIDGNEESVRAKIGAEKEDVVTLMTLQTLQASMMDPIVKDVDTEISDEEAQQTSVTYVKVDVASDEDSHDHDHDHEAESEAAESAESTAESEAASAESTAESKAASAESAAESEAASAESTAESEAASAESAAESEAASAESTVESEAASAESTVESEAASAESTAESEAASAESAAESEAASTESEAETAEENAAQLKAKESAEAIIAEVLKEENVAEADIDAIAKNVDENYYSQTGHFTKADPDSATLDTNLVEAVKDLEDGQLVDHAVESADGTAYYVVRLDHVIDEAATESEKSSILTQRKQTLYDETVDGWVDGAEITVNDDVWAKVTLTDSDPVTLKTPEVESTEADAESEAASAAESAVSEAASAAESAVSEAASAAESAVSEAASAAESAVSEAASAAESAVSEAASAAESAVSEAASTVKSAVSAAESAASSAESAS